MNPSLDLTFLYYFTSPSSSVMEVRINGFENGTPPDKVYYWLLLDHESGRIERLVFKSMRSEDGKEHRGFEQGALSFDATQASLTLAAVSTTAVSTTGADSTDVLPRQHTLDVVDPTGMPERLVAQVQQYLANAASNLAWEAQAEFWDSRMGDEGNDFHQQLVRPAVEKLISVAAGERILDLGCGNGVFSRHLARQGAEVIGVDVSSNLIDKALARSGPKDSIDYRVLDATSEDALATLGTFDAVVCNMVLMDIASLEPLARSLTKLLAEGGRFVFAVAHPCFNNGSGTMRSADEYTDEQGVHQRHYIKVTDYITPAMDKISGIGGVEQYSFRRPISLLFAPFLAEGFVLDGLEEPVFPRQDGGRELSQDRFTEIPWALVASMRRA
ncbi:MAG: methyltransferase domain-containing protein [Gemmatimonadetes bacterium]|jgi:2-polyprenyl-3-methyl-5-hydroxy-6-metoxy-1,4-benzoquinol methylase|nr:methyltransferase domain-containing protein [Gemmatimonadota bacterium]MBT4613450.1 methyltransferase domain-containing protein [Gemmatimonadota bacterium]MBT5055522.1 methyltransferase domain-containing protein [Gemmatimonadota bacterium]MBT5145767.1 methyltransferase domain-containing protein [Gemmatimonadota bacterium]MBT5588003.1 methyltransferase domain-containing protein [Gemmatimonadota bacterium]